MARGITETDVHTAADDLVVKGERPTVERIRAHLGTGSPNTVTRWLETWWQRLGSRLNGQTLDLQVPEAPEAVTALAGQWWALAVASGRELADNALAKDRSALQAARAELQEENVALIARAREFEDQLEAARHAEQLSLTQARELQRLVAQLQAQIAETSQQRDAALLLADQAREAGLALQQQLHHQLTTTQAEREQLTQHIRAVEDRAHQEIDRTRLETRELKLQLNEVTKAHARLEKERSSHSQRAARELATANQQAVTQRTRADALQAKLAALQDLPSVVRAALAPAKPRTTKRRDKPARTQ
ncbi:DNA-binding protein [Pseudoxanthomonas sp. PXM01]|uniref:DNA-binding protein n=1 Tax=Pseudoxanthomonas sp. PXM01 TaxID=2769295 RepID=UPI0017843CA5|nr:DNA-binding protein [Pseudoxanthomonas sp. PXM01]MBD9467729.1 DNA-binding protein [Pseudoxanthomonas sp. PXM01]